MPQSLELRALCSFITVRMTAGVSDGIAFFDQPYPQGDLPHRAAIFQPEQRWEKIGQVRTSFLSPRAGKTLTPVLW